MPGPLGASIRAYRPTCGLPDPQSLKRRREANNFKSISAALQEHGVLPSKSTPHRLAQIVAEIRIFMEHYLGRDAHSSESHLSKSMTILPAKLFTDFSGTGSLFFILRTCFSYASDNAFDLNFSNSINHQDRYFQLLQYTESRLREREFLPTFKVHLSPMFSDEESKDLAEILSQHNAIILNSHHLATHVIYPDPPGTRESETDDQVLCRLLATSNHSGDEECFVHWIHHPDSYDDWVPREEVLGHNFVNRKDNNVCTWHLSARWIRDLALFNEWMNELDYEMPQGYDQYIGHGPVDLDEALLLSKYSRVKVRLRVPPKQNPHSEHHDNHVQSIRIAGDHDKGRVEDAAHVSAQDRNVTEEETQHNQGDMPDVVDRVSQQEEAEDDAEIVLANGLRLPSFAAWFKTDSTHEIERTSLPEFFSGRFASKTEATYKEIRNFMIQEWRKSKSYVSGTAARRHLAGDACAISRIHGFLEHWGLINYSCDDAPPASFNPPPKGLPLYAGTEDEFMDDGQTCLLLDNGKTAGLKGFKVVTQGPDGEILEPLTHENIIVRDSGRDMHSKITDVQRREPIEYHCDSCGVDCSKMRFHCATKADVDLCASCYKNERYSSTIKHRDFIQMTSAGQSGAPEESEPDVWTESETLLLLEALEMYGDNWQLVSEHVGSKGKNQCVTRFVRLPIEDAFLHVTRKRWWNEKPPGIDRMPSPTEIMRTANARESAVALTTTQGSAVRTYSGQPVVCGDQVSTIVPYVGSLARQSSPHLLREAISVMDFDGPQSRVPRPFLAELGRISKQGSATEKDDGHVGDRIDRLNPASTEADRVLSDSIYKHLNREVKRPNEVLDSDYGEAIANAVSSLVRTGIIQPERLPGLRYETCRFNIHRDDLEELKEISPSVPDAQDGTSDNAGQGSSCVPDSVVSSTALLASCVTAAQKRAGEEVELDRLLNLVLAIRMEFVRRKIAHLSELTTHISYSHSMQKRKRLKQAGEDVRRKLRRIDEEEFAAPREMVRFVEGKGKVPGLRITNVALGVSEAKGCTQRGGVSSEQDKTRIPVPGADAVRGKEDPNGEHIGGESTRQSDVNSNSDAVMTKSLTG